MNLEMGFKRKHIKIQFVERAVISESKCGSLMDFYPQCKDVENNAIEVASIRGKN